jgi:pyruvate dehydrogenase E2 component (dihydrolipoamide acetyltransferase)
VVLTLETSETSHANPVNTATNTATVPQNTAPQTTAVPEPTPSTPTEPPAAGAIPIPVERELLAIPEVTPTAAVAMSKTAYASPSVRQFARELDVNLDNVTGTGPKNRITQDDVRAYIKAVMNGAAACPTPNVAQSSTSLGGGLDLLPWPQIDFTKFGEIEVQPLSRIKKISGQNLSRNWVMIPHVTNNEVADITELEAFRVGLNKEYEKQGVKFTLLAFLIKACVHALKKFPEFNASLDGDNLVYKKYYNIGFAADTPNGLVVPVVKDADKKSVTEIAVEMSELAKNAREGKLKPTDMQGGCFSISSLGGIGGTTFTPIINAPEVAILGVSRSSMQPVWNGSEFVPRLMCPLSLSYDHRVIDGAAAARFNAYLANILNDYRRVVL